MGAFLINYVYIGNIRMIKFEHFLESIENEYNHKLIDVMYEAYTLIFEGASLEDIHEKYYSQFDKDEFIAINKSDPTSKGGKRKGKFLPWLLKLRKDGKLKSEDLYKVTEYLEVFAKYRQKLRENDINKIDSLPDLYDVVKPAIEDADSDELKSNKKIEKEIKENETEKVYENNNILILIPKSHRAACLYGKGTQWCTASKDNANYYNQYSQQGPLYIVIDKESGEKFQFHAESNQFMDEEDSELTELPQVLADNKEALQVISHVVIDLLDDSDISLLSEESMTKAAQSNIRYANKFKNDISGDTLQSILNQHAEKMNLEGIIRKGHDLYFVIERQGNTTLFDMLAAHELGESEDNIYDMFLNDYMIEDSVMELADLSKEAQKEIQIATKNVYSDQETIPSLPNEFSKWTSDSDYSEIYYVINNIYNYFMAGQYSDAYRTAMINAMVESDGKFKLENINDEYVILGDVGEILEDEESYDYDGDFNMPDPTIDYEVDDYYIDRYLDIDDDHFSTLLVEAIDDEITTRFM
jgi:hypothetical protein